MSSAPPGDGASLLVPIHLDAWVVDPQNQEPVALYTADYSRLDQLRSPIPEAFDVSSQTRPPVGIALHWALPDALTHGRQDDPSAALDFPWVPNRWLVARFYATGAGAWAAKAWVVQSDFLERGGTPGSNSSSFLDPHTPSSMQVQLSGDTQIHVQQTALGKAVAIDAWMIPEEGTPFLQAVGPGNVSFGAYVPFARGVFSFLDEDDLPDTSQGGQYAFSYLVVGWYSSPDTMDPLRGVDAWDPAVWPDQGDWAALTAAGRFVVLLERLRWSVTGSATDSPPATSLYHGAVVDVQWPYPTLGNAGIDRSGVRVVVGNTAVDALAALVQVEAKVQGAADPQHSHAWTAAGEALAELLQAAQYDLLPSFGTPGGEAMLEQQVERAWYGSRPGGTLWEVAAATVAVPGGQASPPVLTPAQRAALDTQLAALNTLQRSQDEARRTLESLQADLYMLWWKVGLSSTFTFGAKPLTTPPWPKLDTCMRNTLYPNLMQQVWAQCCTVQQGQCALPCSTDADGANQWAAREWSFPSDDGGTVRLADLGLELKALALPRFWHPTDPVVLVSGLHRSQKHGEDGRYTGDGTLPCRLPGQTVIGLTVAGQPVITDAAMQAAGLDLNPLSRYTTVPSIPTLLAETFFADPGNASLMAGAVGGDASAIGCALRATLGDDTVTCAAATWTGAPPVPFALRLWEQAWTPLFLEWEVQYFPTGNGSGADRAFSPNDWSFDGERYTWNGTGYDSQVFMPYKGRAMLTPQAPLTFRDKLKVWLRNRPDIDTPQMEDLLATVGGWDLLSQSLGGLTAQLVTLASEQTFPPPPCNDLAPCPPDPRGTPPCVSALIGGEYRSTPVLEVPRSDVPPFYPVRGGFLLFNQLQAVDGFGQTYNLAQPNSPSGFQLIVAQGLVPDDPSKQLPAACVQLPPRAVQDGRLDLLFLSNDGSGRDAAVSAHPDAVCGWILPNHLDRSLAVYDAAGLPLGEVLRMGAPDNWVPSPVVTGSPPAPPTPADIANPVLREVVASIAAQTSDVFAGLYRSIDETLWMVDPMGGRSDAMLSVLIGRPLAVVQAQVQLRLYGNPATNRTWNAMVSDPDTCATIHSVGEILDVPFEVRLGSLELRDDGVLGYFLPDGPAKYGTFYVVHFPDGVEEGGYLKPVLAPSQESGAPPTYQGDVSLKYGRDPVTVTLLLDPRGNVHASTGILPVTSAALPGHLVEELMGRLAVTFQTGPVIADPGTLRLPLPAERNGTWTWLQRVGTAWEEDAIVDADDLARLPDALLQLRDGWLRLAGISEGAS
jgi:hypothetical protein